MPSPSPAPCTLSSGLPRLKPGVGLGTKNALIPCGRRGGYNESFSLPGPLNTHNATLCFLLLSVVAKTTAASACGPAGFKAKMLAREKKMKM